MSREKFVYVTYIAAPQDEVWTALLEGEFTRQYWKHEHVTDWNVGSKWQLVADDAKRTVKHDGRVLEKVPNKRLVLAWGAAGDDWEGNGHSRAAIDLETVGTMVRVTITHDELTEDMKSRISRGWPLVLSSLKSFLETGRALEF